MGSEPLGKFYTLLHFSVMLLLVDRTVSNLTRSERGTTTVLLATRRLANLYLARQRSVGGFPGPQTGIVLIGSGPGRTDDFGDVLRPEMIVHPEERLPFTTAAEPENHELNNLVELPDVKLFLRETVTKPWFQVRAEIKAPPLSESYGWTGTAFDYLLRFYSICLTKQRQNHCHPFGISVRGAHHHADRGGVREVAEHVLHGAVECRFPVEAGAVLDEQRPVAGVAGQGAAIGALHERDQLGIVVEHLAMNCSQRGARRVRDVVDVAAERDQVGRVGLAQLAGAQVERAVAALSRYGSRSSWSSRTTISASLAARVA